MPVFNEPYFSISGLRIRIFNLIVKLVACLLYVIRVVQDRGPSYAVCFDCPPLNATLPKVFDDASVDRPSEHIYCQSMVLCFFCVGNCNPNDVISASLCLIYSPRDEELSFLTLSDVVEK
ncbi:hypothetical protein TNIN_429001 [Trichonephila inaurata madagascariensis]|uniref:Uncharacterized protein n=1 Tax=Trichonephila inaurata madagascariensis TaxID=2747483 RepID=A0A8X7C9H1_9ARAC|nr:hypothetical protein TNIN_429001 [Trichonephila inaurata madagascariensis]